MDDWIHMRACMMDAGCSETVIERAECLREAGAFEELIHCLRECRCEALEEIHEKQRRLDRLDRLIRKAQQELS